MQVYLLVEDYLLHLFHFQTNLIFIKKKMRIYIAKSSKSFLKEMLQSCARFSHSFPLVPRWHMGPPPRISISACPSPVYWQSPMLVPHLSAPPPQISAMLFWACPSCASLVKSTLAPLLPGCCSPISKRGPTILTFFS